MRPGERDRLGASRLPEFRAGAEAGGRAGDPESSLVRLLLEDGSGHGLAPPKDGRCSEVPNHTHALLRKSDDFRREDHDGDSLIFISFSF
jgi:hypothetical protein